MVSSQQPRVEASIRSFILRDRDCIRMDFGSDFRVVDSNHVLSGKGGGAITEDASVRDAVQGEGRGEIRKQPNDEEGKAQSC